MKREKRLGIPFFSPSPDDQREFKEDDRPDDPKRGINRARLHFGVGGSQALIESRKRKYGDGYELGDESDELPIDHHVMFPQGETRSFRGPDESPDMQAVRATDVALGGKNMSQTVTPIQAPIGSHPLFVMGNPMDMAWRLLKSVLRNKHTGEQVKLVGYDMVPDGVTTHQVAILQDANGQTSRVEQRYIDAHYDYVGEV